MTAAPDKSADGPNPGSRKPKKDGMEVHMRGSVVGQIQALYKISGVICIGMKRHNAKAFARAAGARTSQEIAAQCPITSYATADKYRGIAILFGHYTKTNFRRWDVEATSADDIRDYLGFVINSAVALRTFRTYAAGLNKLAVALNMYATKFNSGRNYDFTAAINELRVIARAELHLKDETREYPHPEALIRCIYDPLFGIVAAIQYEGGARIREAAMLKSIQLRGPRMDDITRKEVGIIFLTSTGTKGGREREISVSAQTYTGLRCLIDAHNGILTIDHERYRRALKKAAVTTSQRYSGSHGLRHSFAQRRFQECLNNGIGEVAAKLRVAHEMGHSRSSITERYLQKTKQ